MRRENFLTPKALDILGFFLVLDLNTFSKISIVFRHRCRHTPQMPLMHICSMTDCWKFRRCCSGILHHPFSSWHMYIRGICRGAYSGWFQHTWTKKLEAFQLIFEAEGAAYKSLSDFSEKLFLKNAKKGLKGYEKSFKLFWFFFIRLQ